MRVGRSIPRDSQSFSGSDKRVKAQKASVGGDGQRERDAFVPMCEALVNILERGRSLSREAKVIRPKFFAIAALRWSIEKDALRKRFMVSVIWRMF